MSERTLPHALDAERAVLGRLLLRPAQLADIVDDLQPEEFFRHAHAVIYGCMVAIWRRGHVIDIVTLRVELGPKLDEVGGASYLAKMMDGVPSSDITEHVRVVRELARRRELIAAAQLIAEEAYDAAGDLDEVFDGATARIQAVNERTLRGDMVDGKAIAARVFGVVQQWHDRRGLSGLTTGFADLDLLTTGLQPGELILLAARPSMGKSALVGQMAYHIAVREQQPVAFFSLEMSVESIGVRMACAAARLDLHRARHGWLREHDMQRFGEVLQPIEQSALFLDEGVTVRTADIRRKAKHLQAQRGLALIIIDYLQLLDAAGRRSNTRNDDVSAISRALKVLAGELQVPVVALSQLNRALERRPDKRPILADLRDSGSLEQDADLVMFLYRDEVYNQTAENVGQAELILAKQRNGPPGTVHLHWTASSLRFDDVVQEAVGAA